MKGILQVAICDDKQDDLKLVKTAVCDNAKRIGIPIPIECFLFQDGERMYDEISTKHFDLVLLDIEMPGMNGFQLAKRISMDRRIPCFIFVSAYESFVFDAQIYATVVRKEIHVGKGHV